MIRDLRNNTDGASVQHYDHIISERLANRTHRFWRNFEAVVASQLRGDQMWVKRPLHSKTLISKIYYLQYKSNAIIYTDSRKFNENRLKKYALAEESIAKSDFLAVVIKCHADDADISNQSSATWLNSMWYLSMRSC